LHDGRLGAAAARAAGPGVVAHHQRSARYQPGGVRRVEQAAGDDRVGVKSGPSGTIASYREYAVTYCIFDKYVAATIGGYRRPAEQVGGKSGGKSRRPDQGNPVHYSVLIGH